MGKGGHWIGVSQVLGGVLDRAGLGHLLYEARLRRNWDKVLGSRAAAMASLETLKDWTLRIRVDDATWRMELHFEREAIRKRANAILGGDWVKDVILS